MYGNICGNFVNHRVDISLTVHSRAILKIVKSRCNGIKKIKCTLMKCQKNVNSTPSTQLPHKFSYIVAILIHNYFESPNIRIICNLSLIGCPNKNLIKSAVSQVLFVSPVLQHNETCHFRQV
jgi:hypothetical protein